MMLKPGWKLARGLGEIPGMSVQKAGRRDGQKRKLGFSLGKTLVWSPNEICRKGSSGSLARL